MWKSGGRAARGMASGAPQKVIGRGGRATQQPKKREVRATGASSAAAPLCIAAFLTPSLPARRTLRAPNRPLNVSSAAQRYFKPHVWWSRV